jgi:regulator of protease activity HflC (stomatin/prohibitin superfamily)
MSALRFGSDGGMPSVAKWGLGLVAVLILGRLLLPFAIVPPGSVGVMTTFGNPSSEVYPSGLHFRMPVAQTMHSMDVTILKGEGEGEAASKDLQSVHTRVAINYHLDPAQAPRVFREIAQNTEEVAGRIITPAAQEAVKAVTARFTAEELITRRTEVREQIASLLREKLSRHGLVLDEFAIVNFAFSPSFSAAIEAKVKAEQEKLKAERDLQRIEVEAKQKVASAQAEAEALRLQKQEVTAELIELRKIENERRAIERWNGVLPTTTGGAVPFIQVGEGAPARR